MPTKTGVNTGLSYWKRLPVRWVSWLLATPLALILLLYPTAILNDDGSYSHKWVMLVMVGISIGFIHAVGYQAEKRLFKWLLCPILAWALMAYGYFLWLG